MLLTYKEGMGAIEGLLDEFRVMDDPSDHLKIFDILWDKLKGGIVKLDGGGIISLKGNEVEYTPLKENQSDKKRTTHRNEFLEFFKRIRVKKGVLHWNDKESAEIMWIRKMVKDPPCIHIALVDLEEYPSLFLFYRTDKKRPFLAHEIQVLRILAGLVSLFMYKEKEKRQAYLYSMSAHTFEKCYNIPVRNMSYLLRQLIHPYNDQARLITFAIQDFIDLWADHISADSYHGQETYGKEWIEGFELSEFQNDLENFATHIFNLRVNDLYDHCNETGEKLPPKAKSLHELWEGELSRDNFFILDPFTANDDIWILGIRPFFRVMLINMLTNAIEALDLFDIACHFPDPNPKPVISLSAAQDEKQTRIIIENQGRPMDEEIFGKLNMIFREARDGNLHFHTKKFEDALKEKEYSDKPGIGTGRALAEAAHYLSCIILIKNEEEVERGWMQVEKLLQKPFSLTRFTIHLPFGSDLVKSYLDDPYSFQKNKNYISFKWRMT